MTQTRQTRAIVLEVPITADASEIWQAISTPEGIARWFPPFATGSGEAGGQILLSWGNGMEWTTTVVQREEGRHVRWEDDPAAHLALARGEDVTGMVLALDLYIEARAGTTVVRLVNSGFDASADWDDQFESTTMGWKYFLFNLKHYVEKHAGEARTLVFARRPGSVPQAEAWRRLLGADGFQVSGESVDTLAAGDSVAIEIDGDAQQLDIAYAGAPYHLWGVLPALGDGLLFVEMEGRREKYHCGVWISLYGAATERAVSLQQWLDQMANRVFPADVAVA